MFFHLLVSLFVFLFVILYVVTLVGSSAALQMGDGGTQRGKSRHCPQLFKIVISCFNDPVEGPQLIAQSCTVVYASQTGALVPSGAACVRLIK